VPGVYISFPFCAQKCSFCNFASGVFPRELEDQYLSALRHELQAHDWHWRPETVYIGGGTPSRLATADLHRILQLVPGSPWREATLEAAPGSLTRESVRGWAEAGIDRVSLGVQSFVGRELARTGRRHDAQLVAADVALLREHGIDNINIDLIAALPAQTRESWAESLDWIERLRPPHVSVYLFEIDEDSRLGLEVIQGGSRYDAGAVPDECLTAELYETAVHRLHSLGIERYEISNFATPGRESLHNLKYWTREPYTGFGADAHSFDGCRRTANVESAADYVKRWREQRAFTSESTQANAQEERFFVGLRLLRGIEPEADDHARYGKTLDRLIGDGLLERDGPRIRLTDRGVMVSNEVFAEFIG
jgi:oxygen-independent coproporphyrinogen III oxidase